MARWYPARARRPLTSGASPAHEPSGHVTPRCRPARFENKKTQERAHVAVKIRLLRMGKIRNPQYRIVVADSRTKRDGRAIEYIGIYQPKEEPSLIEGNADRAQYCLSVGAQPTEPVQRILELTGDWQKFKGLPAPEPLKVAPARQDRKARYEAESQAAAGLAPPAETKPAKKAAKKAAAAEKADKAEKAETVEEQDGAGAGETA